MLVRSLNRESQGQPRTFGRSDKVTDALKNYSLEGKTAFVTGAAGGIGRASIITGRPTSLRTTIGLN